MKRETCSPTSFEVGNIIRKLRILKGYHKQQDFAEKLGISVVSVSKIENGKTDIKLSRLCLIAEVLEINIELLFSDPQHLIGKKTVLRIA